MRWKWVLKFAWRDAARNRGRLFLMVSALVMATAGLTSIQGFKMSLSEEVSSESKDMLGGDVVFSANQQFPDTFLLKVQDIATQAFQTKRFASMVLFEEGGVANIASITSLTGDYPIYGKLEVNPANGVAVMQQDQAALVDPALLLKHNKSVGDSIRIGGRWFIIAGELNSLPGQSSFFSALAPPIVISEKSVAETQLIQPGSRVFYKLFASGDELRWKDFLKEIKVFLTEEGIRATTLKESQERLGKTYANFSQFMAMVALCALCLGVIGIISSLTVYSRERQRTAALLKCLGASSKEVFYVFYVQLVITGVVSALVGVVLGVLLQTWLPTFVADFLDFDVELSIQPIALIQGLLSGVMAVLLGAILPLLVLKKMPALSVIRSQSATVNWRNRTLSTIAFLLPLFVMGWWMTGDALSMLLFFVVLSIVIGAFYLGALGLLSLARKVRLFGLPFSIRQAIANLFRPNNQTVAALISMGITIFVIGVAQLTQDMMLSQLQFDQAENEANFILFDIREEQRLALGKMDTIDGFKSLEEVYIVTMQLEGINGQSASAMKEDSSLDIRKSIFSREYRVTGRDTLASNERLLEGVWPPIRTNFPQVAISENFAEDARLIVGDTLQLNIQGVSENVQVSAIRAVDFTQMRLSFNLIFTDDFLRPAPKTYARTARAKDRESLVAAQRVLTNEFPNVVSINLSEILDTLNELLVKISFVIRFLAALLIVTGIIVLVNAIRGANKQRMKEGRILRTIGASSAVIRRIFLTEYSIFGLLSAVLGFVLSLLLVEVLAWFWFGTLFVPSVSSVLYLLLIPLVFIVLVGWLNSFNALSKSKNSKEDG